MEMLLCLLRYVRTDQPQGLTLCSSSSFTERSFLSEFIQVKELKNFKFYSVTPLDTLKLLTSTEFIQVKEF